MRPLHFVALLSAAAAAYATNCDSPDIFCSPMDGSCWNSLTNLYCNPSQGDSSCCVCVCGQRCVCVRRMGTDERARRAPCDPGVRILDKDGVCLDCPPSCAIVGVAGCVLAANRTTALCNCTAMGAVGSGGRVQLGPASCAAACTNRDYAMIFGVCERLCRPDTNVYGCGGHGICGYSDSGHDNCGCDAEWSGVGCRCARPPPRAPPPPLTARCLRCAASTSCHRSRASCSPPRATRTCSSRSSCASRFRRACATRRSSSRTAFPRSTPTSTRATAPGSGTPTPSAAPATCTRRTGSTSPPACGWS